VIDCTELALLPPATVDRIAPIIEDFQRRAVSGQITVVLHFCEGKAMPSEIGTHERNVGGRRRTKDGA